MRRPFSVSCRSCSHGHTPIIIIRARTVSGITYTMFSLPSGPPPGGPGFFGELISFFRRLNSRRPACRTPYLIRESTLRISRSSRPTPLVRSTTIPRVISTRAIAIGCKQLSGVLNRFQRRGRLRIPGPGNRNKSVVCTRRRRNRSIPLDPGDLSRFGLQSFLSVQRRRRKKRNRGNVSAGPNRQHVSDRFSHSSSDGNSSVNRSRLRFIYRQVPGVQSISSLDFGRGCHFLGNQIINGNSSNVMQLNYLCSRDARNSRASSLMTIGRFHGHEGSRTPLSCLQGLASRFHVTRGLRRRGIIRAVSVICSKQH